MTDATGAGVEPGDILARKYRVERVIGHGGMGVVLVAHHLQLDEKVAIKLLLPEALKNAETVGRFAREARAAVKIKSEHVARVIDVGELESGAPYIVMEYLEGHDLSERLSEGDRIPPSEAVGYVLQACEALAEAHALGIVHRDVKPANLFLAERPSGAPIIKVLDFGISKSAPMVGEEKLTKTSAIMGSPLYMSPEQMMSSKTVDPRSDVWGLGVVLYELLAGAPPFHADVMAELVFTVIQKPHVSLLEKRHDVARGLAAVVDRCLAKEPSARFANVGALAMALAPFGPPLSHVSVDRISHVLGLDHATVAPVGAPSPGFVAPSGGTLVLPILPHKATPAPTPEPMPSASVLAENEAKLLGLQTSIAVSRDLERPMSNVPESDVSSEPLEAAGVPTGRVSVGLLAGVGLGIVAIVGVVLLAGGGTTTAVVAEASPSASASSAPVASIATADPSASASAVASASAPVRPTKARVSPSVVVGSSAPTGASTKVEDLVLTDPQKARGILEPLVFGHRATHEQVRMLRAICRQQHDQACVEACKE